MSILRKASTGTVKIMLDDTDHIEVREEISKRDFNRFVGFMPAREMAEGATLTVAEATELQKGLFEALVVGWSLPVPPTIEEYLALSSDAAAAVDEAVANHFKALSPSKEEEKAGF